MKSKNIKRIMSAMLCAAVATTSTPAVYNTAIADEGKVIYSSDFEDGDVSAFSNRGGSDTTVISAVDFDNAASGKKVLCASERSDSWNGPSFRLDDKCKPGVAYLINAKVSGKYYTNATLSMQYNDSGEETHYMNLVTNLTGGGWQEIKDYKVTFSEDQTDVYIYFEGGSDDIYIDDFSITEAPVIHPESDIPSLKDVYAGAFKIGTATTAKELAPQSTKELILKHFNSLTAGNELKPDAVLNRKACLEMAEEGDDTNPQVSLDSARSILNFARDNNIPVRGHVLVWHQQTPTWFFKENYDPDGEWVSKEKMLLRLENYIKNVFTAVKTEYPDVDFYAWDVVNECWLNDGNHRVGGSQEENSEYSPWVKIFGDNSFIKPAFEFAKKYAPEGTKLYYNDFNEYMTGKTNAMIKMVEEINSDGHYIDGIGMQSHLDARMGSDAYPTVNDYNTALDRFCNTGLDVQITELDATVNLVNNTPLYKEQAQYYSDIMDCIYAHKDKISSVVFWGTTDDQSWRSPNYPLLFNEDYTAKECFYSIIDGIEPPETTKVPATKPPVTTTTTTNTTTVADDDILYGDANNDGKVSAADATAILQFLGNKDKYNLTEKGAKNADAYNTGDGVTPMDALAIQKLDAKVIDSLPLIEK